MRKILAFLFCLAAGSAWAQNTIPSGFLHVVGNQLVDGVGDNVRLACTEYTGSGANADMLAIRTQAQFNCIRVPYFDRGFSANIAPFGLANMDTLVTNAAANSLKVIFEHRGNEGPYSLPTNLCNGVQLNGLPYDLNSATPINGITFNASNGTDGCGDTGTITYAQYKSNIVSIALHYAGNSTVVALDLHNEPKTPGTGTSPAVNWGGNNGSDNRFMCGDTGAAVSAANSGILIICEGIINNSGTFLDGVTMASVGGAGANGFQDLSLVATLPVQAPSTGIGPFTISGGQIKTSSGVTFFAAGMNVLDDLTGRSPPSLFTSLFPHNNFVRLAVGGDGNGFNTAQPNSVIEAYVDSLNAIGIVVEIESHFTGQPQANTVNLAAEAAWYSALAAHYVNQPLVWFGTGNELGPTGLNAEWNNVYNAVRGAGNNNPVMLCLAFGNPVGPTGGTLTGSGGNPDSMAGVSAMHGVIFDAHWYNWMFSGTDQASANSAYTTDVHNAQALGNSADGVIPVIAGESGGQDIRGPGDVNNCVLCDGADVSFSAPYLSGAGSGHGYWLWNWTSSVPAADAVVQSGSTVTPNGALVQTLQAGKGTGPLTGGSALGGGPITNLIYEAHVFPTNVSGGTPDSSAAVPAWNHAFGSLILNNTVPVFVGGGASLDNSNGSLTDDTTWATNFTSYINGTAIGGPAFPAPKQKLSNVWYAWGNLTGSNPNGTLNTDNVTLKSGQFSTYNPAWLMPVPPPVNNLTTWNPSDKDVGITLSAQNFTATTNVGASTSVRSTTSKSAGKFCGDIKTVSGPSSDWDIGFASAGYILNNASGLGSDTKGAGFDPNFSATDGQGIFFNNVAVSHAGSLLHSAAGTFTICGDFTNLLVWATSAEMRAAGNNWNNSPTADPGAGTGGVSMAGLVCPCFVAYNNFQTGIDATISMGTSSVTLPTGFSLWDTVSSVTHHGQVIIQ